MAKTKQKEIPPVATLYDLAGAYKCRDKYAYRRLLENAKVSDNFKKRMTTKKAKGKRYKNPIFQEEEIKVLKNAICDLDTEIKKQESDCKEAEETVRIAAEELRKANQVLKEKKERLASLSSKKSLIQNCTKEEERKLEKMMNFTLVHPTATLSSLDKKHETTIVCTKFDIDTMKFAKFVDLTYDCEENLISEEEFKQIREEFETVEQFISAFEYVKMVAKYCVEDWKCELLYNSPSIKHMLDILGI